MDSDFLDFKNLIAVEWSFLQNTLMSIFSLQGMFPLKTFVPVSEASRSRPVGGSLTIRYTVFKSTSP